MIRKSFLLWFSFIPLAILNGALREKVLIPLCGETYALPLSGLLLCLLIFAVTYVFLPRLGKAPRHTYLWMGVAWLIATAVFEFLLGTLQGESLQQMLTAYDITTGNLWLLVVLFIALTPYLTARIKKLITPP